MSIARLFHIFDAYFRTEYSHLDLPYPPHRQILLWLLFTVCSILAGLQLSFVHASIALWTAILTSEAVVANLLAVTRTRTRSFLQYLNRSTAIRHGFAYPSSDKAIERCFGDAIYNGAMWSFIRSLLLLPTYYVLDRQLQWIALILSIGYTTLPHFVYELRILPGRLVPAYDALRESHNAGGAGACPICSRPHAVTSGKTVSGGS